MGARDGEQRIQQIEITAVPATGEIVGLTLTEVDGAVTSFRFAHLQENVPASDSDFRFTPPAG